MHRPGIELYMDMRTGKWRYRMKAANGMEVATSVGAWEKKKAARRAALRFLAIARQIKDYWIDTETYLL